MTKLYTGRMDPVIKAKWVAALRSGEYKQGFGGLQLKNKFCCLGVLCDLHSKETGTPWDDSSSVYSVYIGQPGMPPESVYAWAKLDFGPDRVSIDGESRTLNGHNDKGVKFDKIAQAIEDQL